MHAASNEWMGVLLSEAVESISMLTLLQVSLRMSKELPLVVQYRIVDMGEIK